MRKSKLEHGTESSRLNHENHAVQGEGSCPAVEVIELYAVGCAQSNSAAVQCNRYKLYIG